MSRSSASRKRPSRHPGGDRQPASGLPAGAVRAGRPGHRHRVERGTGRGGRGQLGEAAQGPVAPGLLRHPRRRLRRGVPGVPGLPGTRAHPGLARDHRRRRQPGPRAGQLRRLRLARVPDRGDASTADPLTVGTEIAVPGGQARRRDRVGDRQARRVDRRDRHPGRRPPRRSASAWSRPASPASSTSRRSCSACRPGVDVRKVDLSIELQILAFHAQRRAVVRVAHGRAEGPAPAQARLRAAAGARRAGPGGGDMSVLVVGLSHKSAPVATLERAALSGDALGKLLRDVSHADDVAGSFVVSTCNRVEVYAEVDKFHGGVSAICELLARHAGIPLAELTPHLYVHYEDRAVQHLLSVACGLDSMVVGESQILGQVRQALRIAGRAGHARPRPVRPRLARAARGQAGARRDRDRPGGREPGQRRARPPRRARRAPDRAPAQDPLRWPVGARGRRGLDELAGRRHRGPDGRGPPRRGQPDPAAGRSGWRPRSRPPCPPRRRTCPGCRRDRRRRPGRLLHRGARHVISARTPSRPRWRRARRAAAPLVLLDLALPRDVDPARRGAARA